jgi:hypothetical protein
MGHLVVPNFEKYNSIVEGEKTTITLWSKYFSPIYPSIDDIAIDFQKNYDGRYFALITYQILLYKLFGNTDLTFQQYDRLVLEFNDFFKKSENKDELYEKTIQFLIKILKLNKENYYNYN